MPEYIYDQNAFGPNRVRSYTEAGLQEAYGDEADEAWANRDGSGMPQFRDARTKPPGGGDAGLKGWGS